MSDRRGSVNLELTTQEAGVVKTCILIFQSFTFKLQKDKQIAAVIVYQQKLEPSHKIAQIAAAIVYQQKEQAKKPTKLHK